MLSAAFVNRYPILFHFLQTFRSPLSARSSHSPDPQWRRWLRGGQHQIGSLKVLDHEKKQIYSLMEMFTAWRNSKSSTIIKLSGRFLGNGMQCTTCTVVPRVTSRVNHLILNASGRLGLVHDSQSRLATTTNVAVEAAACVMLCLTVMTCVSALQIL